LTDLTDNRSDRLRVVASHRQKDLTIILENVHDRHNIGAILRTCDSVGIHEIYVIYTDDRLSEDKNTKPGKTSSSGASKWINVHHFTDVEECFAEVRKKYHTIIGTALSDEAKDLYAIDLTQPTALLFGNESVGLSATARKLADSNFLIPQVGFVQSLNISVACAVSIYEAYRQRNQDSESTPIDQEWTDKIYNRYANIHTETRLRKQAHKTMKRKNNL